MPQLFVLSGPDVGKSFELKNGDSIGRSPDCVVTLRDASVSRRHAHIERHGPQWFVVDDGSRNGIAIDGAKQKRAELRDMQEFAIGEILVRFRAVAAEPHAEAPSAPPIVPVAPPKPAPPPVAPSVAPTAADEDELVLGGGDDEIQLDFKDEPPPRPAAPPPPPPRAPMPEVAATKFATRPPPPPPPTPSVVDTGFGPARNAGDTISRRKAGAGDRVLQYNKVENQRGFAGTDIAQFPLWLRALAFLFAFALAAGIAYVSFFGTSKLKSTLGGSSEAAPADAPSDAPADAPDDSSQDGH